MVDNTDGQPTIVISGSFRKYYTDIRLMIKEFEGLGIPVLSPKHSEVVNPGADFVLLETDDSTCPEKLEREHFNAICSAHALYLYNPGGYVGPSSAMEIGWALALNKQIYVREVCEDLTLRCFAHRVATPEQIQAELSNKQAPTVDELNSQLSLDALQQYVKGAVARRGFASETPRDKALLMIEEFGELARALRKHVGLKTDRRSQHQTELKYELADILFYLLDLANVCGISLSEGFRDKERENTAREWN